MGRLTTVTGTQAIDALLALFAREGYARVEPAVLQPADVFVDLSGEDIRRRMFVTQDAAGAELCLRPEYTIPGLPAAPRRARRPEPGAYSYGGPVFRLRTGETRRVPAGGDRVDRPRRRHGRGRGDVGLALEGLEGLGASDAPVRLGDMGLLDALIDALDDRARPPSGG